MLFLWRKKHIFFRKIILQKHFVSHLWNTKPAEKNAFLSHRYCGKKNIEAKKTHVRARLKKTRAGPGLSGLSLAGPGLSGPGRAARARAVHSGSCTEKKTRRNASGARRQWLHHLLFR